jgi:hypothetical protein
MPSEPTRPPRPTPSVLAIVGCLFALAGTGACVPSMLSGPRDVSGEFNFRPLLQGRCFRVIVPGALGEGPRGSLSLAPHDGVRFANASLVPASERLEFRVTRLVRADQVTGHLYVFAEFLNGPHARRSVTVEWFFWPERSSPSHSGFVIGPGVEPCDGPSTQPAASPLRDSPPQGAAGPPGTRPARADPPRRSRC